MLQASIIGNLGSDPEMAYSASGAGFLRFNVASNFRAKSQSGEWEDRTEWVRCTVFGARAESLSQYLKKGTRVFASGRLEARPWTDQQGNVRAGLELVATDVEFMSSRSDEHQSNPVPVTTAARPARAASPVAAQGQMDDLSDIPF